MLDFSPFLCCAQRLREHQPTRDDELAGVWGRPADRAESIRCSMMITWRYDSIRPPAACLGLSISCSSMGERKGWPATTRSRARTHSLSLARACVARGAIAGGGGGGGCFGSACCIAEDGVFMVWDAFAPSAFHKVGPELAF